MTNGAHASGCVIPFSRRFAIKNGDNIIPPVKTDCTSKKTDFTSKSG